MSILSTIGSFLSGYLSIPSIPSVPSYNTGMSYLTTIIGGGSSSSVSGYGSTDMSMVYLQAPKGSMYGKYNSKYADKDTVLLEVNNIT